MVNQSQVRDQRFWDNWKRSGAIGNIDGQDRGEAYAFFDCSASLEQITEEIPIITKMVQTPKRLELCLAEKALPTIGKSKLNRELASIAVDAYRANLKYVLLAISPANLTNAQTADELSAILNQAYQSPLYRDNEQFRGRIVYEEDGFYVDQGYL